MIQMQVALIEDLFLFTIQVPGTSDTNTTRMGH